MKLYVELARPFTLIAPALGFFSGALTAIGAHPREAWHPGLLLPPIIGAISHDEGLIGCSKLSSRNSLGSVYQTQISRNYST